MVRYGNLDKWQIGGFQETVLAKIAIVMITIDNHGNCYQYIYL